MSETKEDNIFVHWSGSKEWNIENDEGTVYTYKGLENTCNALHASIDLQDFQGSGKKNLDKHLFLFKFNLDTLKLIGNGETRSTFLKSRGLNHALEKKTERDLRTIVENEKADGWELKYELSTPTEYVVLNKSITPDMIVNDMTSAIDLFIDNSISKIKNNEEEIKKNVDLDTLLAEKPESKIWISSISIRRFWSKQTSTQKEVERIQELCHENINITASIRLLSNYSSYKDTKKYEDIVKWKTEFTEAHRVVFTDYPVVFVSNKTYRLRF